MHGSAGGSPRAMGSPSPLPSALAPSALAFLPPHPPAPPSRHPPHARLRSAPSPPLVRSTASAWHSPQTRLQPLNPRGSPESRRMSPPAPRVKEDPPARPRGLPMLFLRRPALL